MPITIKTNTTADGTQVVALRELTLGQAKFLETDDGYEEMAINGTSGGSATVIWNGTGGGDTGGDWTHINQGTEESYAKYSGTNGLDSGVCSLGQSSGFDYGENIDIEGVYDQISFWMQPKAYPTGSNLQILWRTSAGTTKGNVLDISNYVSNFDLDIWQKVTIPITDFNLDGNQVAKVLFKYASKGGQQFYFDDIELKNDGTDGPFTFRVAADGYYNYHIGAIYLYLATGDSGWSSDAFGNITSGLENGLLIRHYNKSTSQTRWSINLKNNRDLYGRMVSHNNVDFFDNEHIATFVLKPEPASIIVTENEVLDIVVRDDLSSLNSLRAFVQYGAEEI